MQANNYLFSRLLYLAMWYLLFFYCPMSLKVVSSGIKGKFTTYTSYTILY